jgi:hypothetical protein
MPDPSRNRIGRFQQLMQRWESLAPYNAGQTLRLTCPVPVELIRDAWQTTIRTLQTDALNIRSEPLETAHATLDQLATTHLNRPFHDDKPALRPFAILDPHSTNTATTFGLFYRHCIADSSSIRLLTRAWIGHLLALHNRTTIHPTTESPLVPARRDPTLFSFSTPKHLLSEFRRLVQIKRTRRLAAPTYIDTPVAWFEFRPPVGWIDHVVARARDLGLKVNDLFVASLAIHSQRLLPHEGSSKRLDLGIGTIADVRDSTDDRDSRFGLRLGLLQQFIPAGHLADLDHAIRFLSRSRGSINRLDLDRITQLRLALVLWQHRRLDRDALIEFYRKRCPLMAGISNVNLSSDSLSRIAPDPLLDYVRQSPLGPTVPLVLTPTTIGGRVTIGVTHRPAVIDSSVARSLVERFVTTLAN